MPINLDTEDLDDLEKREGGRGLRRMLEDALKENRALAAEATTLKASGLIRDKGLDLVKPEDLAGVDPKDLEAKALELQEQKIAERRQVVKDMLEAKGYEGEDLDAAVDEFVSPSPVAKAEDQVGSMLEASRTPGRGPSSQDNVKDLHGSAAIEAYFASKSKKK